MKKAKKQTEVEILLKEAVWEKIKVPIALVVSTGIVSAIFQLLIFINHGKLEIIFAIIFAVTALCCGSYAAGVYFMGWNLIGQVERIEKTMKRIRKAEEMMAALNSSIREEITHYTTPVEQFYEKALKDHLEGTEGDE